MNPLAWRTARRLGLAKLGRGLAREGRRLAAGLRARALHALGRPSFDPFEGLSPEPARRAAKLVRPAATRTYALLFTPRSGSSRLEEILAAAGTLGRPGEVFNPRFARGMARAFGATDMADYVALLRRVGNRGGVFGFEATWPHVLACFGSAERFGAMLRPDAWVWLVREDIVLQAVSISRMVQTGIAHNIPKHGADRLARAEARFDYSARDIAVRIRNLRDHERGAEALFARLGARPLRLSYERLLPLAPADIAARVARHVGASAPPAETAFHLHHQKLGTDKNLAFARRFRAENPGFVARVERRRASLLAALDPLEG